MELGELCCKESHRSVCSLDFSLYAAGTVVTGKGISSIGAATTGVLDLSIVSRPKTGELPEEKPAVLQDIAYGRESCMFLKSSSTQCVAVEDRLSIDSAG